MHVQLYLLDTVTVAVLKGRKWRIANPRSVEKTGLQRLKPQRTGNSNVAAKAATYKAATDKPQSSGASLCGRFLQ
jgi:hypothetical protein